MEIISVRVGSPSQTPAVNIENPSQVNATLKNVNIQTGGTAKNAVLYDPQDLTDAQKEQARTNIAAASQADLDAQAEEIRGKQPAGNYITNESDPTVPAWAKEPTKPTYTANEVGARPATWTPTASEIGALPDTTKIPSNTSDLTNDSGFITKAVNDLANYYLKSETYSKTELDNKISAIPKFSIEVVGSLPTTGISDTTVYLLASGNEQDNLYTEYIYVNGAWEFLGKQTVDLTGYVKRTELSAYYTSTEIDSLLTTIRNSIPTKLSQLTEDSSHRVVTDAEKQSWNAKADKATTLAGYGITDGATKEDFNELSEEIEDLKANGSGATAEQIAQIETNKNDIADIKEDLIELSQIEAPKIVSSVAEMTDPTKHYVMDGYIYYNKEVVTETEPTSPNVFDPSKATLNVRFSISSGSTSTSNGYFATDYIEVPKFQNTTPYNVRLNWVMPVKDDVKIMYYDSSKAKLGGNFIRDEIFTVVNGETVIDIKTMSGAGANATPDWTKVAYIRLQLDLTTSTTALTSADIANCKITLDANQTAGDTTVTNEWVNSLIPYTPTFKTDLVGVLGEGNVIYLSDNLPSGTYTLKYGDEAYATVGTITVS